MVFAWRRVVCFGKGMNEERKVSLKYVSICFQFPDDIDQPRPTFTYLA